MILPPSKGTNILSPPPPFHLVDVGYKDTGMWWNVKLSKGWSDNPHSETIYVNTDETAMDILQAGPEESECPVPAVFQSETAGDVLGPDQLDSSSQLGP